MRDTIKIPLIAVTVLSSIISFFSSICEVYDHHYDEKAKGHCEYESIISYFPVHYISCELIAKRFHQEPSK